VRRNLFSKPQQGKKNAYYDHEKSDKKERLEHEYRIRKVGLDGGKLPEVMCRLEKVEKEGVVVGGGVYAQRVIP
jgi:hypothetical protein